MNSETSTSGRDGTIYVALQRLSPGLFVLLWSTGFIGAKLGLPYAEPFTFLSFRFLLVIVLLLGIALVLRRPWPRAAQWGHLAVVGTLLHGGYLSGVFNAIHHGLSAGVAALIVGTQPLLTAAFGGVLLGERITRLQLMGLLLGFAGVVLVVWDRVSGVAGLSLAGLAYSCLALLSITGGTLYQKRFCGHMDLWTGSVVQFVAATVVLAPFALATETLAIRWTGEFLFALTWLVLVLSVGAIGLLYMMLRRGEAARVSSLFYLTPPVTALMGYLIFGETLGALALAGMATAAAGVALAMKG